MVRLYEGLYGSALAPYSCRAFATPYLDGRHGPTYDPHALFPVA